MGLAKVSYITRQHRVIERGRCLALQGVLYRVIEAAMALPRNLTYITRKHRVIYLEREVPSFARSPIQ